MAWLRAARVKMVWALELALGLELYACAVLALHARGLRATPLEASLALVLPALVIPPVFYVLVGLVSVRPRSIVSVGSAAASMSAVHAMLVVSTGALFMIPDLVDFTSAIAFALWGSPAVTLLQLTAAPLVFARLKPLLVASPRAARAEARAPQAPRRPEAPAIMGPLRPLAGATPDSAAATRAAIVAVAQSQREQQARAATPAPRTPVTPAPVAASAIVPSAVPSSPVVLSPAPAAQPTAPPAPAAPPSPAVERPTGVLAPPAVTTPAAQAPAAAAASPSSAPAASGAKSSEAAKHAIDWTEPMIRVPFVRIADQLPVEMFTRGREGLKDTLRPGVSLLVPRKLLLPHLGEGLAPVKWDLVADQFPRDELALSHDDIAARLPEGSLLLPLDEVIPQIPPALLALSTPPADVHELEEFPVPFQPQAPAVAHPVVEPLDADDEWAPQPVPEPVVAGDSAELELEEESDFVATDAELLVAPVPIVELEAAAEPVTAPEPVPAPKLVAAPGPATTPARVVPPPLVATAVPAATPAPSRSETPQAVEPAADLAAAIGRSEPARRIAALLAPLLNGLEIGQREGAGATLVTVVAPTLSENSVVRAASRAVPFLADSRLPEPVTQATVTAADATLVLTPFGPRDAGAILLTAVCSRASLAWLERLSRAAAHEAQAGATNGKHAAPRREARARIELRAANVPAAVRELAGSLTAFGPVSPTLLRDRSGALCACLFLPSSLDALPLAGFAHDLHAALAGSEVGRVASVILKLGAHRVVLRSMDDAATMLVGAGRIDRPGLARIELDRVATRLGALVGS